MLVWGIAVFRGLESQNLGIWSIERTRRNQPGS